MITIKPTDFGIAYASGDCNNGTIEINPLLFSYPTLLNLIIDHEIKHLEHPSFLSTIQIDFIDLFKLKKQWLLFKFTLKHKCILFQSILPIWKHQNKIEINTFLMFLYCVLLLSVLLFNILIRL